LGGRPNEKTEKKLPVLSLYELTGERGGWTQIRGHQKAPNITLADIYFMIISSVEDPDPNQDPGPHVFGPPESGSGFIS
jgi:hypothetical protein